MTSLGIALTVGLLFAAGAYLLMHRNAVRVIIAVMLLSNGANLAVLAMSRDPAGRRAPLVDAAQGAATQGDRAAEGAPPDLLELYVDPLPQALILTAIVIGFGVMAFLIALVYCSHAEVGTVLLHQIDEEDEHHDAPDAATSDRSGASRTGSRTYGVASIPGAISSALSTSGIAPDFPGFVPSSEIEIPGELRLGEGETVEGGAPDAGTSPDADGEER